MLAHAVRPRPEDLLGRPAQPVYGAEARQLVTGRRVLVTGAAGSIGSELVRQLSRLDPAAVYLLDTDEGRLHALQLELHGHAFTAGDSVVLSDIRHAQSLDAVFRAVRPEIVFHAAALKHLNLLERFPCEGVKTNVLGTQNVLEASFRHGVDRFINVSTDKAADPTSVLGATKRLAEMLIQPEESSATRVASVRFGNVIGSRGSFYDTLVHQMSSGSPVTITHPSVTRFLMTIPEAAGLVIEAAALAQGGEIYVLDMGEPVRMLDLVERYADLAGLPSPKIRITGLMPGEKLHEVLFSRGEEDVRTAIPRVWRSGAPVQHLGFRGELRGLITGAWAGDPDFTRSLLTRMFPGLRTAPVGAPRAVEQTPSSAGTQAEDLADALVAELSADLATARAASPTRAAAVVGAMVSA